MVRGARTRGEIGNIFSAAQRSPRVFTFCTMRQKASHQKLGAAAVLNPVRLAMCILLVKYVGIVKLVLLLMFL